MCDYDIHAFYLQAEAMFYFWQIYSYINLAKPYVVINNLLLV